MSSLTSGVRSTTRSERGAIAVVTALLSIALLALAGVVIDLGHARDVRRQAINAADAAALAAGNQLYLNGGGTPRFAEAVADAKTYARTNVGVTAEQWDSCTDPQKLAYVPPGSTQCVSFDRSGTVPTQPPSEVRVRLPLTSVQTHFSPLFGQPATVDVSASAHALLASQGRSRCGLCVTGPDEHRMQNGDATVTGGDIHFNGDVSVASNGLVSTTGAITVQGAATGGTASYEPDATMGQPPITDPLAFVTLPPFMTGLTAKSDPCSQGPGIYGDHNFPNSTCTLSPGLYVIAGSSSVWQLNGNTNQVLAGTGVTLYFTCGTSSAPAACASPGSDGASLDASGNGQLSIKAPASGALQGLAVIYDRLNVDLFKLTGGGANDLQGTIYLARGTLQMNGNGCSTTAIDSLVVVDDLVMKGDNPCLNAAYNAVSNVTFPPGGLRLSR